ncbi:MULTISPECIES: hypothetical protein [unclassified Polaromonas]|uniref:hypothetical protein n=1 Tax=unclassified Polaromonas TaxID=2638319 RepID=UPI0018C90194|nr:MULTISPECIES: hypothetical protein [unclassified Polaromonas]MBG6071610.1 hypothetical protein [Polaromonas sp. CG_9.7]MBG6113611.1 hypothetical protein [Polaromonas sp. CG_9.2]MDH6184491.1 hypothetical protein [Polaromonas sp. CG_23.6]
MAIDLNLAGEPGPTAGRFDGVPPHDLDRQRLRILRCTAHAMASSPGGLRFKPGTRPWLEGLPSAPGSGQGRHKGARLQPAAC